MDTVIAAPDTEAPAITNLEAQTRCRAYFQANADYWREDGNAERALYWQALANSCQGVIDGIIASGDDDWIGF